MEGDWLISGAKVHTWQPRWWVQPSLPIGEVLTIGPHESERHWVSLEEFAWYRPVPGSVGNVRVGRNEGDGRFLFYAWFPSGLFGPGGARPPAIAISFASWGADTLIGRYSDSGRGLNAEEYRVDFTFLAQRL